MKNKIFLWPLSLAVIFFASFIIIFSPIRSKTIIKTPVVTPTPANTKNYFNSVYQFGFSYPLTWQIYADNQPETFYLKTENNNTVNFNIFINNSLTIGDFLAIQDQISATAWEGQPSLQVQSTKKTIINGLNCIQRQEYLLAADITRTTTYFKNGNYFLEISLSPVPGNNINSDLAAYQALLSTFYFHK